MLVGIHQLHYLPWLRYFEKILRCDVFVVLDNIQFNKNGWQNRNRIKTAAGALTLTVPVYEKLGQTLEQVRIRGDSPWRRKHWQSVRQSYGSARFFRHYGGFLEHAWAQDWLLLNDLNFHMLPFFAAALGITTPIVRASELHAPGESTERLVNLIRAVGGTTYYSGAHAGDTYLDIDMMQEAGIGIEFQRWQSPVYAQLHDGFIPDLSIVDLLMNRGGEARGVLERGGS